MKAADGVVAVVTRRTDDPELPDHSASGAIDFLSPLATRLAITGMGHRFQRTWPSQLVHPRALTAQLELPRYTCAAHAPYPGPTPAIPAQAWAPAPAKKRQWVVPAILVAVFVGLPLLFVGTIFGAVYLASKGPRDRAHAFADAIHERKFEKARGMLVDDLQAEMSPAQFRKQMDDSHFSHGRDLSFHSFNIRNRQACFDGEVNGVLVNFRMEQVRGAWRIRSTERGNFCH